MFRGLTTFGGLSEMKKLFNILLLILVVISFSGIASASYVTDKGHTTTYHQNYYDYYNWYLVYYSNNHCTFVINDNYKYTYHKAIRYTYIVDYRTYNKYYNIRTYKYYKNGHYIKSSSKYIYTTSTPYAQFKREKYTQLRSVVT